MSSLIAATAAGPAHGFHREAIARANPVGFRRAWLCSRFCYCGMNTESARIPRRSGGSQPLTPKQRRQRWMQLATSIGALLLILAEVVTHPWFHHEM